LKAGFIRSSGEPISHISKLRERVLKSSPKQTPITNEDGIPLNNSPEGIFVLIETGEKTDLAKHLKHCDDNQGLAAPSLLSQYQIDRMAEITFKQPKGNIDYNICEGR
jgi:hypothetical protein